MRFFWFLYNINPAIVASCSHKDQKRYATYGLIVFLVFLISFFSGSYLVYLIIGDWFFAIPIGGFLAWNFLNLYRLIMLTINPRDQKAESTGIGNYLTYLVRAVFMLFLVLVVIKPIELKLLENQIEPLLEEYEQKNARQFNEEWLGFINEEESEYREKNDSLSTEIREDSVLLAMVLSEEGRRDYLIKSTEARITNKKERISENKKHLVYLDSLKKAYREDFEATAKESLYLVERLRILMVELPWSWIITVIAGIILLFPILLKRFFIKNNAYFINEKDRENLLILSHYGWFKSHYEQLWEQSIGQRLAFFEAYEDPPFNRYPKDSHRGMVDDDSFNKWKKRHT